MNLRVLAFGRMKTPGLSDTRDYYLRNISRWVSIEESEMKARAVNDSSVPERNRVQQLEAEDLQKKVQLANNPRDLLILLDEKAKGANTIHWVDKFQNWENSAHTRLNLVIGSSRGFSSDIHSQAHGSLSLGPQTLSHELARIVLLEQIYRVYSVINRHPYHVQA